MPSVAQCAVGAGKSMCLSLPGARARSQKTLCVPALQPLFWREQLSGSARGGRDGETGVRRALQLPWLRDSWAGWFTRLGSVGCKDLGSLVIWGRRGGRREEFIKEWRATVGPWGGGGAEDFKSQTLS